MKQTSFRAWDTRVKKMYFDVQSKSNFQDLLDDKTWEVMQFTGLLDKNGKEVFDGDVVAFSDTYTETVDVGVGSVPVAQTDETAWGIVIMKDYQWGLDVQMNTEVLEKGFNSFYEINENFGLEDIEVIGNIYQNKELLS